MKNNIVLIGNVNDKEDNSKTAKILLTSNNLDPAIFFAKIVTGFNVAGLVCNDLVFVNDHENKQSVIVNAEKLADEISGIFGIDYNKILELINKNLNKYYRNDT